jgi:hypothetical protein
LASLLSSSLRLVARAPFRCYSGHGSSALSIGTEGRSLRSSASELAVWDPPRRRSATHKGAVVSPDDASHPTLQVQRSQSARCDLRPTRLMSGVAHLRRFHGLLWDPYAYPYSVDCRHPRAAHDVMFNGSAEYATAPMARENARTARLKTAGGNPVSGSSPELGSPF